MVRKTRRFEGMNVTADFIGGRLTSPPVVSCPSCGGRVTGDITNRSCPTAHCDCGASMREFKTEDELDAWFFSAENIFSE